MNEEEAIEKLKYINMAYDCNNYYSRYELDCIETVLNLLENKDKQIEQYKNMLATNDMLHVLECEKKDKMIEYMANFINDNTPYTKDTRILENERGVRNTKYTEQYFEYKVEEGK